MLRRPPSARRGTHVAFGRSRHPHGPQPHDRARGRYRATATTVARALLRQIEGRGGIGSSPEPQEQGGPPMALRLTNAADYAVRSMLYIASLPEGRVVLRSEVAGTQ